jgi:hypothetical protein
MEVGRIWNGKFKTLPDARIFQTAGARTFLSAATHIRRKLLKI